jgi:hypothetical protein
MIAALIGLIGAQQKPITKVSVGRSWLIGRKLTYLSHSVNEEDGCSYSGRQAQARD